MIGEYHIDGNTLRVLSLVHPNNKILRQKVAGFVYFSDIRDYVLPYIKPMKELMEHYRIHILSAPHVGLVRRFFIMGDIVCINPYIWNGNPSRPQSEQEEFDPIWPGLVKQIALYDSVDAQWTDPKGNRWNRTLTGYAARLFQRGYDELEGKCLFPDIKE